MAAPNRISRFLTSAIVNVLQGGSHSRLDGLFLSAGAPEPIPPGSHGHKWHDWIQKTGRDPTVDNCEFIGALIEEFMLLHLGTNGMSRNTRRNANG
jgi:hypothetical protein